jgi:hypothetical protein
MSVTVIFLVVAAVLKKVLGAKTQEPKTYPYKKEQALLSPAERSFLGVLEQTANGRYRFMGKVRLADVVKVKGGMSKGSWQNAFNRIQSKHLDIVACDPATFDIRFAIELDDSSHKQSRRQERDDFVGKALHAAGIPIAHVTAKSGYSAEEIRKILL